MNIAGQHHEDRFALSATGNDHLFGRYHTILYHQGFTVSCETVTDISTDRPNVAKTVFSRKLNLSRQFISIRYERIDNHNYEYFLCSVLKYMPKCVP